MSAIPHHLARDRRTGHRPWVSRFVGRTPAAWTLVHTYGVTDVGGPRPDVGRYFREVFGSDIDPARLTRRRTAEPARTAEPRARDLW